ncbi:unnamed protein product [Paramecium sonneborni]|uniref:Myb-like DNA-binding domain-containing protein n=1 Tax=Paramecium sonneborni TaxID=65129 RepID=A0A8S1M2H0_9CILI|nr:unnamed protein product [Paramecium sonneborni]
MDAYNIFESQWKKISEAIPGKTEFQCIQRWEMLQNEQLTIWTREEDEQLIQLVLKYGEDWKQLALIMKNKIQTQIETRFIDLNIIFNSQPWNEEEEDNKLLDLFDQYGTKWNQIAKLMKDRSVKKFDLIFRKQSIKFQIIK